MNTAFLSAIMGQDSRPVFRIADIGDSTMSVGLSAAYTGDLFCGMSNAIGLAGVADGTLTIYSGGGAKWAASGDTAGALVSVGDGAVWLESGSADKGMRFIIVDTDVAAASPSGTEYTITLTPNSVQGYAGLSSVVLASIMTGFKFDITAIHGYPGRKTTTIRSMIGGIFGRDSMGKQISQRPKALHISGGINDLNEIASGGADFDIDDVCDELTAIKDDAIAEGAIPIFANFTYDLPSPTLWALMQTANAHLAAMAAANPSRVKVADYFAAIHDPGYSDGRAREGTMWGGAHFLPNGAQLAGEVLAEIIDSMTTPLIGRSRYVGGAPNLIQNGDFSGNDGIIVGGDVTGETSWHIFLLGDGASCVASKESVLGEQHDWQKYVITTPAGAPADFAIILASLPFAIAAGDELETEMEFYVDDPTKLGGDPTQSRGPKVSLSYYDASLAQIGFAEVCNLLFDGSKSGAPAFNGLLKSPKVVAPADAAFANKGFVAYIAPLTTVTIKLRNAGARKVE